MTDNAALRNNDAEEAILSACMDSAQTLATARSLCTPGDFASSAHEAIFAAMLGLAAEDVHVDPLTVSARLERDNQLVRIGGKEKIGYLLDVAGDPSHVRSYAEIVQQCALRRRLARTLADATMAVKDGSIPLTDIAGSVQASLSSAVSQDGRRGFRVVTSEEIIALTEDLIARGKVAKSGQMNGVATGYPELDEHLCGLRAGELLIIGARPKAGKTALSLNIATNAMLDQDQYCGFISTEMLRGELLDRMANRLAGLSTRQTANGYTNQQETARYATCLAPFVNRMHIDDEPFPNLDDVLARSLDLKARHPEITFLVIDYLQRVTKRMKGRRGDEELGAVTSGIKSLAKELKIPIIAPAQVNYKETDKRESKAPTLADIQGGSSFAQDANFVFLLHRPGVFDNDPALQHVLEVELAAGRRVANFATRLEWYGSTMMVDSPRRRANRPPPPPVQPSLSLAS